MASLAHYEHGHHVTPTRHLTITLIKLIVLMVLTVVLARVTPLPNTWAANLVAMGIAITKAVYVISIFMGVKFTTNLAKLFAIGGFVWLTLIFGILIDYASRPWEPVKGWEPEPSTSLPRTPEQKE